MVQLSKALCPKLGFFLNFLGKRSNDLSYDMLTKCEDMEINTLLFHTIA